MKLTQIQPTTTGAVSWEIWVHDEFNVPRIDISFNTAPSSAGLITVSKDAAAGAAYDVTLRTLDPVGLTSVYLEGLHGFSTGDKVVVTYANPDARQFSGSASVEIPVLSSIHADGLSFSDGTIRSKSATNWRYYHVAIGASNPGASGATYETPTANYLGGMRLNAVTDVVEAGVDVHQDWDNVTWPKFEAVVTLMAAGTNPADIVKFRIVLYYGQPGRGIRTQTVYEQATIGTAAQYTMLEMSHLLDPAVAGNLLLPGDQIFMKFNLTADSDAADVLVNHVSFAYATTHLGREAGDI